MADREAPRVSGDWIVAATRSEVQPDKLRRLETWLFQASATPMVALLIDFVPISGGPGASPFIAGETLAGEVVFYPSATPLRGQLSSCAAGNARADWPALPDGLGAALSTYEAALGRQPWLELWPLAAGSLKIARLSAGQLVIVDDAGVSLPLDRAQTDALTPMLGLGPLSALFTWDGRFASLLAAQTPIGRWHED